MNKEKQIEVLEELIGYINENWDAYEYADDIKNAESALKAAITLIKSSNVSGSLTIGDKNYLVIEVKES